MKPLKPTPTSSPLLRARHLDRHGEPTHPDLVRTVGDDVDDAYYDPDLYLGPCLCKNGTGTARTFWFWFSDGGQLGMKVRSLSYSDGVRAARAEFEKNPWMYPGAKMIGLVCVETHDDLSEARNAKAALTPRTRW